MRLILSCDTGIETFVQQELDELGYSCSYLRPSKLVINRASVDDMLFINARTHTVHHVYLSLMEAEVDSLEQIIECAGQVDYAHYFTADQSFAVKGAREGRHEFGSMDMAREVGSAVVAYFQRKQGRRIPVDLNHPQVEIAAMLYERAFFLMLNTSGASLHRRIHREYHHFAALKPSLAAAMLRASSWRSYGSLLDPMAGSGTIPIEAVLHDRDIAPGRYTDYEDYLFSQLHWVDRSDWKHLIDRLRRQESAVASARILASDRYSKSISGMKSNFRHLGLEADILVQTGRAESLHYVQPGQYPCVVVNPPYGVRMGSPQRIKQLYSQFARACADKQIKEVAALTPRKDSWIKSFIHVGYHITMVQRVLFGRLNAYMITCMEQNSRGEDTGDNQGVVPE